MAGKKGGQDDDLLQNLNIEGVEGLEGVHIEAGGPLPKKVELDIDDALGELRKLWEAGKKMIGT